MAEKLVHLATAPDQLTAELWVSILRDQGIDAMIHPSDAVSYLGLSSFSCRVQVPASQLHRAHELIEADEAPSR